MSRKTERNVEGREKQEVGGRWVKISTPFTLKMFNGKFIEEFNPKPITFIHH